MKVLVTGAGGFLGRAVVERAAAVGYEVTALVRRPGGVLQTGSGSATTVVAGDLRIPGQWTESLPTVDAVIHAAAAAGGARAHQLANTVVATERLLTALSEIRLRCFVHISSLSVYDYDGLAVGANLDERSPLVTPALAGDAYTEAKLVQEHLVRHWCAQTSTPSVVLRPGAIVGPGKTWDDGAALSVGRWALVIAPRARFRMISLGNCAEAIVDALEVQPAGTETINLVDDDLPSHAEYFRACRRAGAPARVMVPVPWRALDAVGRLLHGIDARFLGNRLRTPELLDHRRQAARWKPLRYPNDRAHRVLDWRSRQPLDQAVRAAIREGGY